MKTLASLDDLRKHVSFGEVVSFLIADTVITSDLIRCPHPDHNDATASFKLINDVNRGWRGRCFGSGCSWAGDIFDLIKLHRPNLQSDDQVLLEFFQGEALELLGDATLSEEIVNSCRTYRRKVSFRNLLMQRCIDYRKTQERASVAIDELVRRGIEISILDRLPYGVFSYHDFIDLWPDDFSKDKFDEFNIYPMSGDLPTEPVISHAFFYFRAYDILSAIKFRVVNKPTSFSRMVLQDKAEQIGFFGIMPSELNTILRTVIAVEGEFDALMLQSRAIHELGQQGNVISCSGSAIKTKQNLSSLLQMSRGQLEVVLWPDNDKSEQLGKNPPGTQLVADILKARPSRYFMVRVVWPTDYIIPENMVKIDPADYLKQWAAAPFGGIMQKVRASKQPAATWLAVRAMEDCLSHSKDTAIATDIIRAKLIEIAVESNLMGFDLDDYCTEIASKAPFALQPETLRSEVYKSANKFSQQTVDLAGVIWSQSAQGYAVWLPGRKKEEPPRQIIQSNYTVEVEQVVEFLETGYPNFSVCRLLHPEGEYRTALSEEDWVDSNAILKKFRKANLGSFLTCKALRPDLENVITAFNPHPQRSLGIVVIGTNVIKGEPYFIYPQWYVSKGMAVADEGKDQRFYVHFDNETSRLYDVPLIDMPRKKSGTALPTEEHMLAVDLIMNGFLEIYHDPFVPLCALGHAMVAPLIDHFRPAAKPYVLYLEATRGAGKTHLLQAAQALFTNTEVRKSGGVNASWTWNRIQKEFSYQRGVLQCIDDLKPSVVARDLASFIAVMQGYHDRQGRGRLSRTLESMTTHWIKGMLFCTGEGLPTSDSGMMSRFLILKTHVHAFNEQAVHKIMGNEHYLPTLLPHYIAWLQRKGQVSLLSEINVQSKSRADVFFNIMGTGLDLYLGFLVEELQLSSKIKEKLMAHWVEKARLASEENIEGIEDEQEDTKFMDLVVQLLSTRRVTYENSPFPNLDRAACIGRAEGDYIYLYQDVTCHEVSKISQTKWERGSISRALRREGWLVDTNREQVRVGTSSSRVARTSAWVIRRERLETEVRGLSLYGDFDASKFIATD